jgi:hypothetical protein
LKLMRKLLKNPSPAEARLLATETELISCRLEGSGRYISGGGNPVKERGPWAVAHLRVVTPFAAIPVRKLISLRGSASPL